jgi:hypothetical protein
VLSSFFRQFSNKGPFRRIELAQLHPRREQPMSAVSISLPSRIPACCVVVWPVIVIVFDLGEVNALIIHTPLNSERGRFRLGPGEFMIAKNVDDCIAVRDNIAIKLPFASQLVLQQNSFTHAGCPLMLL